MRLSNTGYWVNAQTMWKDPYKPIYKKEEIKVVNNMDHKRVATRKIGCSKCNYEGYYRDYDGTWLEDCDCMND